MKYSDEQIRADLARRRGEAEPLIRQGVSDREIAKRLVVSATTVRKWRMQLDREPRPPGRPRTVLVPTDIDPAAIDAAERAVAALSAADPAPEELGSTLDEVRSLLLELKRARKVLSKSDNTTALVRVLSTCVQALNNAARLEKTLAADQRAITVTPEALDAARDKFRERTAAILARPLLCNACNRALSIEWGTGSRAEPETERGAS